MTVRRPLGKVLSVGLGTVLAFGLALGGTAAAAPARPVTVTFWYGLGGSLGTLIQTMVGQFNRTHPDVHVVATFEGSYSGGGQEQQKLLASLAAGDAPNLAQMEVDSLSSFAARGALLPLNPLMFRSQGDRPADFLPGLMTSTVYHGKYYGVPFNRSVPLLFYNQTLFRKAHIAAPPKTWTQLAADAAKLSSGTGPHRIYGFDPLVDWWPWEAAVWSGGGTILAPGLKTATFASPAALRILNIEQTIVKRHDGYVETGPNYWNEMIAAFSSGQAAMDIDSSADIGVVATAAAHHFQWNTALYPALHGRHVPPGGGDVVMLRGTSPEVAKAAWTFIQWWTAPSQTTRWSEATGYLPLQRRAAQSPAYRRFLASHPQYQAALKELSAQEAPPPSPQYFGILQYVQQGLTQAFDSGSSLASAMKQAAQSADSLLRSE